MASRAEVERFRSAQLGLVALIRRDLADLWAGLAGAAPETARDALLVAVPELVARYGSVAADVAADFYDDLRAAARVPGGFRAAPQAPTPPAAVERAIRWAVGPLWEGDPPAARGRVDLVVSEKTLRPARQTITTAATADPQRPRWARVPQGAQTCAFCLVMASRGFIYASEATAGRGNDYHDDCDCLPVVDWSEDPRLEGYDPDGLLDRYEAARAEAGRSTLAGSGSDENGDLSILQVLRRETGAP